MILVFKISKSNMKIKELGLISNMIHSSCINIKVAKSSYYNNINLKVELKCNGIFTKNIKS